MDIHSLVLDFEYSSVICVAGKANLEDWLALVQTRDASITLSSTTALEDERESDSEETYMLTILTGALGSGLYNEKFSSFTYATPLGEQINTMLTHYAHDETAHDTDLSFMSIAEAIQFANVQVPTLYEHESMAFDAYFMIIAYFLYPWRP